MNDKMSTNFIYLNLWAPTAGLLQDLTVNEWKRLLADVFA